MTKPAKNSKRFSPRFKARLGTAVATIAVATLASRMVGFLRWLAQSAFVGSGSTAGAYASANQIPNIIFEIVVGGALAGITVPLLAASLARGRHAHAHKTASALLTWVVLILTVVGLVVFVSAGHIARLLPVPQDTDVSQQYALITHFLRVFAWQIPLYGISIVLTGVLQAYKKFWWPAIAPALSSVVAIATFITYALLMPSKEAVPSHHAVNALAWGTTAGVAALSLPLFIPAYKAGFRYRPTLALDAASAKKAVSLGASGVGALIAQQVSVVVGLMLMRSYGQGGTVAVFQYIQAVYWLPYAILAYPIATAAFPLLSEQGESGCTTRFQRTCSQATKRVAVAALVAMMLLIGMAPVVEAFFSLLTPVDGMSTALVVMAPALIGYSLLFFGQRALYALCATATAWKVAATGWITVALAQVVLVQAISRPGADGPATLRAIAGGHTVGMSVGAVAVIVALTRLVGKEPMVELRDTVARSLPTVVIATAPAWLLTRWISSLGSTPATHLIAILAAALGGVALLVGVIITVGKSSVFQPLTTPLGSGEDEPGAAPNAQSKEV